MRLLAAALFAAALAVPLAAPAHAAEYVISIPFGASDAGAPFFWEEEATGATTGIVTVNPGDTVRWDNADTAFHTVTSVEEAGFAEGEFVTDGAFDSGFFTAGKSHEQRFDELGSYHYYCTIHPFMAGIVHVVNEGEAVRHLAGAGAGLSGDGGGYGVEYILDTALEDGVAVDTDDNTVTFAIQGQTQGGRIVLTLPPGLLSDPGMVWVDGAETGFETEPAASGARIEVPIGPGAREVTVMGSSVVPEFGAVAAGVLAAGIGAGALLRRGPPAP